MKHTHNYKAVKRMGSQIKYECTVPGCDAVKFEMKYSSDKKPTLLKKISGIFRKS